MNSNKTNIAELLGDLNAGVFEEQINTALSDIAREFKSRLIENIGDAATMTIGSFNP